MSTAKAKTNPQAGLPGARHRWRFHLSALFLLIPVVLGPEFFQGRALLLGNTGLGEREIGEKTVGPWHVTMAELRNDVPTDQGLAGHMKTFVIRWSAEAAAHVRASYFQVGRPRSPRAAGVLLSGSLYRQMADVPIPERAEPGDALWLTVEAWDGTVHQTSIPLNEASPATVAWLEKRAKAR